MRTKGSRPNHNVEHSCKNCGTVFIGPACRTFYCKICRIVKKEEKHIAYKIAHRKNECLRIKEYRKNPKYRAKQIVWNQKWAIKNRGKRLLIRIRAQNKRRSKTKETFSENDWEELKKEYNWTCHACGKTEPEIKLTVDHKLPLSKDGRNVIENIQPLCKNCNSKKQSKLITYPCWSLLYGEH